MPNQEISQIKIPVLDSQTGQPTGQYTTYDIKDAKARSAYHRLGESTSLITDGGNQIPTIEGQHPVPLDGDVVLYGNKEFMFIGTYNETLELSGKWHEFGDLSGLGSLAYKDYIGVEDPSSGQTGDVVTDVNAQTSGNISIKNWEVGSVKVGRTFSAGSLPSMTVNGEVLTFNAGSLPSLTDGTSKKFPVVPADDDIQMTVTLGRYTTAAPSVGATNNYLMPAANPEQTFIKKKLVAKNNS